MILYFDTETTGLYPGHIVQLSYVMDYGDRTEGKNFYFSVDYVEPSAISVHGYTPEILFRLSDGKSFECFSDEIYNDFFSADLLVAHNFKFDFEFLLAEFSYIGKQFRYRESFDTMRYFTPVLKLPRKNSVAYKFPKLSELCEYCDVFPYDVSRGVKEIFGKYSLNAHEARFDTTAMYLCVQTISERLPELKKLLDPYLMR